MLRLHLHAVKVPIQVKAFRFVGQVHVEAVFQPEYPYVNTARVCLMQDPVVDFAIRPLGSVDLMDV